MTAPQLAVFAAGEQGEWRIDRIDAVCGDNLPSSRRLAVRDGIPDTLPSGTWQLRGVTSHLRYMTERERKKLAERESQLGRNSATRAALIPIRKNDAWWRLAQDERRAIFEERSRHIAIGFDYMPNVARRLHHCRDLAEPFDFLTWFEYAPTDAVAFEEMVERLRKTEEWRYIDREIDIRLTRDGVLQ